MYVYNVNCVPIAVPRIFLAATKSFWRTSKWACSNDMFSMYVCMYVYSMYACMYILKWYRHQPDLSKGKCVWSAVRKDCQASLVYRSSSRHISACMYVCMYVCMYLDVFGSIYVSIDKPRCELFEESIVDPYVYIAAPESIRIGTYIHTYIHTYKTINLTHFKPFFFHRGHTQHCLLIDLHAYIHTYIHTLAYKLSTNKEDQKNTSHDVWMLVCMYVCKYNKEKQMCY